MEFSSDGKQLLSLGTDGVAKLWDVRTGKSIATFKGHRKPGSKGALGSIWRVALSPDSKIITSAERYRSFNIILWDVATAKKVATLTQPNGDGSVPPFLLFSPDGKSLLSLGRANYLWDLETKNERVILKGLNDEIPAYFIKVGAFDPKSKPLVLARERPIYPPSFDLWTADSNKEPAVTFQIPLYEERSKGPKCLAFSRDCKTIASADGDRIVRLWDAATGKNTAAFPKLPGVLLSLAYSPDGKVLAVGYQVPLKPGESLNYHPLPPPSVGLYEVATGKVLATLTGEPGPISPLVFSPDGRTLATSDGGPNITLSSLPARYAPPK